MGEYINVKNFGKVKMGTCENLRYVTRQEAMILARNSEEGFNAYLPYFNAPTGVFWRLPEYSEDMIHYDTAVQSIVERAKNRDLDGFHPMACLSIEGSVLLHMVDIQHHSVVVSSGEGRANMHYTMPCPASPAFHDVGVKPAGGREVTPYWYLYAMGNDGRLIFRCGHCGTLFSLCKEEEIESAWFMFVQQNEQYGEAFLNFYKPLFQYRTGRIADVL